MEEIIKRFFLPVSTVHACPQHNPDVISLRHSLTWHSWETLRPPTSLPEEPEGKGREPQLKTPGRREGAVVRMWAPGKLCSLETRRHPHQRD